MQLILQPCGNAGAREHFVDTIQSPVALTRILPFLQPEERARVQATFSETVAVWGVTPGKNGLNAKKWQRITLGDAALMYRQKNFFFRGTMAYKTHCPALAHDLWGVDAEGATWSTCSFLRTSSQSTLISPISTLPQATIPLTLSMGSMYWISSEVRELLRVWALSQALVRWHPKMWTSLQPKLRSMPWPVIKTYPRLLEDVPSKVT